MDPPISWLPNGPNPNAFVQRKDFRHREKNCSDLSYSLLFHYFDVHIFLTEKEKEEMIFLDRDDFDVS